MPVSAIIPAYNEEKNVGNVLTVLKNVWEIGEIIVVNDGSRDNTARTVDQFGVRLINLPRNMGKGAALKAGLDKCCSEYVLFLDADLVGLTENHIRKLMAPVLSNSADMTIGVFRSGRVRTDWAQKICPYLSGQRAVRKAVLDNMKNMDMAGYGIEIALTKYIEKEKIKALEVELDELTHIMKEEKLGVVRGLGHRMKMYWQIYRGLRLHRTH